MQNWLAELGERLRWPRRRGESRGDGHEWDVVWLGRDVALKILAGAYTQDQDRIRRFRQEATAASALNHPGILTIHEAGDTDGCQFIATEFVDGETVRQMLDKRGRVPLNEALGISVQVAAALAAAHKAGIVHRDIKPENVMVRPDGYVKLLDFGIAKLTQSPDESPDTDQITRTLPQTRDGAIVGTVPYMSPEQARGLVLAAASGIAVDDDGTIARRVAIEGARCRRRLSRAGHRRRGDPQDQPDRRDDRAPDGLHKAGLEIAPGEGGR